MSTFRKISLSMFISILLFALCMVLCFFGGFSFIEVNFYRPKTISQIDSILGKTEKHFQKYILNTENGFEEFLGNIESASYIEKEADDVTMKGRRDRESELFESQPGLEGMRLVESDGRKIHFSTFESDIMRQNEKIVVYEKYPEKSDVSFAELVSTDKPGSRNFFLDQKKNRIIFSFPYYDRHSAYRGTFLFYVSGDDFARSLRNAGIIEFGTKSRILPNGIVFNIPIAGRESLSEKIAGVWSRSFTQTEKLTESDFPGNSYFLITSSRDQSHPNSIRTGWVLSQNEFEFSRDEKTAILLTLYMTLNILVLLLFSLKRNESVLIKERIKRFQYELLKAYIDRKETDEWEKLAKEIELRRHDIDSEVKKSFGRKYTRHSEEIERLLEESWKEIALIAGKIRTKPEVSFKKPEQEISQAESAAKPVPPKAEPAELEELPAEDEIAELEPADAEPAELEELPAEDEIAELEPADAEPAELEELPAEDEIAELEPADAEPAELEELPAEDEKLAREFSVSSLNFSFLDDENKEEEKDGEEK